MATQMLLSVGDGVTSDYLSLDGGDYAVAWGTFSAPPPASGEQRRIVSLALDIQGATTDALWANERAIETKLRQAREARGPYGIGSTVTLGVQFKNASNMVFFDVLDGTVEIPPDTITGAHIVSDMLQGVFLTLVCLPYARGAAITDVVSGTLTNGDGATLYRAAVPGDAPALTRLTISDVSTLTKVINRLRIGVRGLAAMASGDFDPIIDDTALAPGVSAADATAIGGNRSRITTSTAWQNIASFSKPAAQYTSGLFRAFLRVRDSAGGPGVPTWGGANDRVTVTSGGTLPLGTYTLKVVSVDASARLSAASDSKVVTVSDTTNDAISLNWTVATDGSTVTDHRVYWKRDSNAWQYKVTASAGDSYTLLNETGGTIADPPTASSVLPALARLGLALPSATTVFYTDAVTCRLSNNQWELLDMGLVALPPARPRDGDSAQSWIVHAQGRGTGGTPTLDIDALYLFPISDTEVATEVWHAGLTLATKRDWIIDTDRELGAVAYLVQTGTSTEAGQLRITNPFLLPPGDCLLMFHADVANGLSDIVDAKFTVTLRITPRYAYVRGAV